MAKGPGVSVTSRIIATSQNNIHYYIENAEALQAEIIKGFITIYSDIYYRRKSYYRGHYILAEQAHLMAHWAVYFGGTRLETCESAF